MNQVKRFLAYKAYQLRLFSLLMTTKAGSGHPTSCLSAADLVSALFFYAMRYDPLHFFKTVHDHFILSKGHAAPLLYAAWKEAGVLQEKDLYEYRSINSVLEGHPTARFPYAEAATGSLGMGLSFGAGMALADRFKKSPAYTYVLMGDSEISEGSVWEAVEIAAHYKLDHLIALVDCNGLGQSTQTLHDQHVDRYAQQFAGFGWHVLTIDGHDMYQIMKTLDKVREVVDRPTVIIAKTIKGYGVASVEGKMGYHGKPFSQKEVHDAMQELQQRFPDEASYHEQYAWNPTGYGLLPEINNEQITLKAHAYKIGESIATRHVYGQALAAAGAANKSIVSLDAEVKNSTFADIFEAKYPERFVQCFIAEQNMIGMSVGFAREGFIPFASTFSAFLTRAHDQLRMAVMSDVALRVCGSHAGVSIGQDGPSQMGLEDIALMRTLPHSVILYPCDAPSTYRLVEQMCNYTAGISYLRTTRMATPVIYGPEEEFFIGKCKVLRLSQEDKACVIAAGITVHEALKAYEILAQEGIAIAVVDAYSVKPLDVETIARVAAKAGKCVVTVEDHYVQGGLGEAVCAALADQQGKIRILGVTALPRSGKPEELLADAGIDAAAIGEAVKNMISR